VIEYKRNSAVNATELKNEDTPVLH